MSTQYNHWAPSIGDPTILGWVTVAVYFIVALICLKAAFISTNDKSIKIFWACLTFFLVFLGLNKQLDFQTLLTQIGREIAFSQGWYENRRAFQTTFILLFSIVGFFGLSLLIKRLKKTLFSIKISLAGFIILCIFILIRASQFSHVTYFFGKSLWYIEILGIIIIGIGGLQYIKMEMTWEDV